MHLKEIRELVELPPRERAMRFLQLGKVLCKVPKKPMSIGKLPEPLLRDTVAKSVVGDVIARIHGVAGELPNRVRGLSETGRRLKTEAGAFADLVLTPRARKRVVAEAMTKDSKESIEDLAMRQLALGLCDSSPLARVCSAYAYWQATGGQEMVMPILNQAIASEDEEEKVLAAHALRHVSGAQVTALEGTAKDDKPQTPVQPVKPSLTVLIHGTFARDSEWYKPGGSFHTYIKNQVYPDLYSVSNDFFFWSGRYAIDDDGLRVIWRQAAKKLISWCQSHPAKTLRLIAHSHGNNVVNMATQMGLKNCTLVQLSPAVRAWNPPLLNNISSERFFNFHSRIDLVVAIDGGAQDYVGTEAAGGETRRIVAKFGHSDSHEKQVWRRNNLPRLVHSVCG